MEGRGVGWIGEGRHAPAQLRLQPRQQVVLVVEKHAAAQADALQVHQHGEVVEPPSHHAAQLVDDNDGGRIAGEYRLTVEDVRSGRRFDDSIGRCAWPIEFWDPHEGVSIEYLPDGSSYEIPLRSLTLRGYANVWAAGKCLSAEPLAQASARVVGTCWAMGEAAGRAAAG